MADPRFLVVLDNNYIYRAVSIALRSASKMTNYNYRMDEKQQSFQAPQGQPPPPFWQAGNYYQVGNLVWWAGSVWKCEKPHTSGPFNREVR